jgi:hypothetical protein
MYTVPAHLRSRVSVLGELSRPLGEARAAALAREVATSVIAAVSAGKDPERTLDEWVGRIACEIAANARAQADPSAARAHVRSLRDLLPEVN